MGGGVSQHALQVSRPTPKGGSLGGSGWGVSRPTPKGKLRGIWSRPTPKGDIIRNSGMMFSNSKTFNYVTYICFVCEYQINHL